MKVSTQRIPESQVVLEIEVDQEQMERSLDRAYRKLVQRVEVPGFRKGKTPRNMLERHLGRDRLLREAIDILIPEAYNEALDSQEIDAIDQPSIELIKDEPLSFKATVPIRPTVELGDYKKLRVDREFVLPDEKDVDESLEELRRRYAVHEPVERPVHVGDIVTANVRIVIDDREVFKDEDAEFRLREDTTILLPGFAEGMIGAKKGEVLEIPVHVPPGEQPLSGKSGIATVLVKEIKQERLPEPNDDFAREVGEGFAGMDALRDRLRDDIRERMVAQAEEFYREKALTQLVAEADAIEYPPILIDREIERLIRDQARSAGRDVDSYLELIKKDARQIKEDLTPAAMERVRRSLVLSRLAEDEKIDVEPAEIEAEIEKIVSSSGQQAEQLRALFASPDAQASIGRSLLTRKTMDRLAAIAGDDYAATAAVAVPKKKTKAKEAK